MQIKAKFNLMLLAIFSIGLAFFGYFSYDILQKNAQDDIAEKAGVMMGAASAIRDYTVSQIKPHLEREMKHTFLPQSVPAYSATETFNTLRKRYPEYSYKEATLNPTNPRDRAADWEADIIHQFRNHPNNSEISGTRKTPTGPQLYLARPIKITNPDCLTCHSLPELAPKTMLIKYGPNNGFNWQLNEIIGIQLVTMPMSLPIQKANYIFMTFTAYLIGIFILIFIAINIMLNKTILQPICKMSELANKISTGQLDLPELDEIGHNEISTLAASFNRMRTSLEQAIKMLNR